MGDLLQCGCAEGPSNREPPPQVVVSNAIPDAWEWGGCGDDVDFAYHKSKEFMDISNNARMPSDLNALVTLHNNEAGRLVSKELSVKSVQVQKYWVFFRTND